LEAIRDCLFNVSESILHVWRTSPPSAIRERDIMMRNPRQGEDGGNKFLRNLDVLPYHDMASEPRIPRFYPEHWSNEFLRNVDILSHNYMASKPRRPRCHPENGGNKVLRNVGILSHNCTASEPRRSCLHPEDGSIMSSETSVSSHTTTWHRNLEDQDFALKMEAARSSETLVSCHITVRRRNPENHAFNLKMETGKSSENLTTT
jgi:hypothetical protein